MKLNNLLIIFIVFLFTVILINIFLPTLQEGFRQHRNRHRNRHRHRNSNRRHRRWYSQHLGYRYVPPLIVHRWNWKPFAWQIPFWNARFNYCPTGCSNLGRGRWGCQNPGNGPNDCIFASDCAPCGY